MREALFFKKKNKEAREAFFVKHKGRREAFVFEGNRGDTRSACFSTLKQRDAEIYFWREDRGERREERGERREERRSESQKSILEPRDRNGLSQATPRARLKPPG